MTSLAEIAYQGELKILREQNAFLQEENRQLRERFVIQKDDVMEFRIPGIHLTFAEACILHCLLSSGFVSRKAIFNSVFFDNGNDFRNDKNIDVHLCKIRRKLKPLGITIRNVFARGFSIADEQRRKLSEFEVLASSSVEKRSAA